VGFLNQETYVHSNTILLKENRKSHTNKDILIQPKIKIVFINPQYLNAYSFGKGSVRLFIY